MTKGGLSNYFRVGPQYILTFVFFEKLKVWWQVYGEHRQARRGVAPHPGVQKSLV